MKKNIVRISLIIGLLLLVCAAIVKNKFSNNPAVPELPVQKKEIVKTVNDQEKQIITTPVKKKRRTGFKSNEEIKEEYGKIETVHLWNGKVYTGAVVNSDEIYSIVTVEGVVKIPMKDVKLREIIR